MIVIQPYCKRDSGKSSYQATHPPCERDVPCKSCNELTKIEVQIEGLHSRLKDLHERHRRARSMRNLVHNGPFIHQLPPEIVADIFVFAFSPRQALDCHNPGKELNPLILSKVCQTWRELSLSTPSLWSRISVDAKKPNLPLLNHHVAHSGVMKLSIHLFLLSNGPGDDGPSTFSKVAMSLIVKQLHRTSSLCINLPVKFITEFSSLSNLNSHNTAPLLKEFHVHCSNPTRLFRVRLAVEPPHPRKVFLEGLLSDQVYLDWSSISHLTLKNCFVAGPLSEILVSKDLKHLTLEKVRCGDHPRKQTYPSIESLTLRNLHSAKSMLTEASLPSLRNLEIKVEDKGELYPMLREFLYQSQCPLQALTIYRWGNVTSESIQALVVLLENVSTLQHLTIDSSEYTPASSPEPLVRRLLRETNFLPCLQTLSLRTRFTLPINLLLNLMTADGHSSSISPGRPLRKLNLKLWMPTHYVKPLLRAEVLRILQLQAAGTTISICCAPRWDLLPLLVYDVVERWKCWYKL